MISYFGNLKEKMKFSELIQKCIEIMTSFNPVVMTLDSHADTFLEKVFPISLFLFYQNYNRLLFHHSLNLIY